MSQIAKRWNHECKMRGKISIPAPRLLSLIRSTQWWSGVLHVTEFLTCRAIRFCCCTISENPAPPQPMDLFLILLTAPSNLDQSQSSPSITVRHNLFKQQLGTQRIRRCTKQDKENKEGLELAKWWLKSSPVCRPNHNIPEEFPAVVWTDTILACQLLILRPASSYSTVLWTINFPIKEH